MHKTSSSIVAATAAAAALMLSSHAFAQAYLGVAAGQSHLNDDCTGTTTCALNSTGMKLFAGYRLNPTWAAEVNYFDFGKAKATLDMPPVAGSAAGSASGDTVSVAIKAKAIGVGLVGSTPASANWLGLVRFGVVRVKADVSGSVGSQSVPSDSDTSAQAYIGLGIGYTIAKNLTLDGTGDFSRARWRDSSADVRLISIGLTYGF
jgi:OOP family OmpA-OmpF porin